LRQPGSRSIWLPSKPLARAPNGSARSARTCGPRGALLSGATVSPLGAPQDGGNMDDARFDALTRAASARRSAIAGGLAAVAALLGLVPEAGAHNALRRCRTLHNSAQRKACRHRARIHNRRHRCTSRPPRRICADLRRCSGVAANDCGRLINCGCPTGLTCMANGGCAPTCPGVGEPGCPEGCRCVGPEVGNGYRCLPGGVRCEAFPLVCENTAACPPGSFCQLDACYGPSGGRQNRCMPLCPAHA
jgi:hypothetical protein